MTRLEPLDRRDLAAYESTFAMTEALMGFLPSSLLTMARRPALLEKVVELSGAVFTAPGVSPVLLQYVAHIASRAAGCQYCQAHTAAIATHLGEPDARLEALWDFERSDLFDDAERAALRLARDAAVVPNGVTDAHFDELRQHYSDDEILSLVAAIALMGFLNRFNDTMATTLEAVPLSVAANRLATNGWTVGKHARAGSSATDPDAD